MLKIDDVKAQEGLSDLNDEQIKTIVELANNTTKEVVATEKGKLFGRFDSDIEQLTGIPKEGAIPTHVYLKNAFQKKFESTGESPELQKKIEALTAENEEIKKRIKAGDGSEALKAELEKQTALVEQLRADQQNAAKEWETKLKEKDEMYNNTLVDNAFNEALAGLKFKDESLIPATVRNAFISNVKKDLLSKYKAQFTEQEGKRVLEFLDENGQIVRNADNARHPYTAKELLSKGLESILDKGREKKGGGSAGGNDKGQVINLSDARTQVEADELIAQNLMAQGIARGSAEFMAKHHELRTEAGVTKLPIR